MTGILTPAQVYRKWKTDGVPESGKHDPEKDEIIPLLERIEQSSAAGIVVRQTKAALDAVTPGDENAGGWVLNDSTASNNGYYYRSAGAWVKGRGFPDTFAAITLAGAANAQTGTVGSGVNPADIEVYHAVVTTANTGPMTLSISGETARDVVNAAGNALSAGEWTGVVLFFLNDDGDYQLLIDAGAAAAAAQSATDAAASADRAESYAAMLSADKIKFATVALLLADNIMSYTPGSGLIEVGPGDIIEAQGFRYEVAASGASEFNEETAGGVKLISPASYVASDLNELFVFGPFVANGTTLHTPAGLAGAGLSIVIDADNAVQNFVSKPDARTFSRAKAGGAWSDWRELSAVAASAWPTISGDNLLDEVPVDVATGWTLGGTTSLTSDGSKLTLDGVSAGDAASAERTITGPSSGDYIIYCTLSAESVAGSYVNVQLGGVGDVRAIVSLGYNWTTTSAETNRISARMGSAGAIVGPIIDFSAGPVELALLYNDEFGAGTLFVKESGAWVGYGVVACTDMYRDTVRITNGGLLEAALFVHELFVAKPNIVAVGDSITEGATLYAPDPAEALTNYASTWMAYAPIYEGVRNNVIVNKGIGSQDSAEIDARMSGILTDADPQIVFLQASANDYGAGFSNATRTANIQASVDKIVAAGAKIAVVNAVYPGTAHVNYPASPDYYREWWEQHRTEVTGVDIFIDWMAGSGILDGNYMNAAYTQSDAVHPNAAGYELLGAYIASLEA